MTRSPVPRGSANAASASFIAEGGEVELAVRLRVRLARWSSVMQTARRGAPIACFSQPSSARSSAMRARLAQLVARERGREAALEVFALGRVEVDEGAHVLGDDVAHRLLLPAMGLGPLAHHERARPCTRKMAGAARDAEP
jgi:hypothetical protein